MNSSSGKCKLPNARPSVTGVWESSGIPDVSPPVRWALLSLEEAISKKAIPQHMPRKLPHCGLVLGRFFSSCPPLSVPALQPDLVSVVSCAFWLGACQPGNTCPFSPILRVQPKRSWEFACTQPSTLKAPQAADGHKQPRVYFSLFCRVWTCGPALHFTPKIQSKTVLKNA